MELTIERAPTEARKRTPFPGPYRRTLAKIRPGFCLDIGAGDGRTLRLLGGNGVGIDASSESVQWMRSQGLRAYTPEGFSKSDFALGGLYDSLVFSHILETVSGDEAEVFVARFLPFLKPGGRIVVLHYPSSSSYSATQNLDRLFLALKLKTESSHSFPLPRWAGWLYSLNECVVVARAASEK